LFLKKQKITAWGWGPGPNDVS